jgi:hypothetical protein
MKFSLPGTLIWLWWSTPWELMFTLSLIHPG